MCPKQGLECIQVILGLPDDLWEAFMVKLSKIQLHKRGCLGNPR